MGESIPYMLDVDQVKVDVLFTKNLKTSSFMSLFKFVQTLRIRSGLTLSMPIWTMFSFCGHFFF